MSTAVGGAHDQLEAGHAPFWECPEECATLSELLRPGIVDNGGAAR